VLFKVLGFENTSLEKTYGKIIVNPEPAMLS